MPNFCLHRFFIRLVAGLMLIWAQPIFAVDLKAQGWELPITVNANGMVPTLVEDSAGRTGNLTVEFDVN
jgi:hypothetical protein